MTRCFNSIVGPALSLGGCWPDLVGGRDGHDDGDAAGGQHESGDVRRQQAEECEDEHRAEALP
jgi:hypothetical protein